MKQFAAKQMPKKVVIRMGRARRVYVAKLLNRGLHGNTAAEVVETLFCRGLQECVPAEWMRDIAEELKKR